MKSKKRIVSFFIFCLIIEFLLKLQKVFTTGFSTHDLYFLALELWVLVILVDIRCVLQDKRVALYVFVSHGGSFLSSLVMSVVLFFSEGMSSNAFGYGMSVFGIIQVIGGSIVAVLFIRQAKKYGFDMYSINVRMKNRIEKVVLA